MKQSERYRDNVEIPTSDKICKNKVKPHDAYLNAIKQKKAIIPILKNGDWNSARKYVEDLIKSQKNTSKPVHIAMSLCALSRQGG
jgi:hypothetical protein